jgi:1,4-dihydroxy-6-naphthoate synthase
MTDTAASSAAAPTVPMRLGHSPDSDDAFMFYGLAEGKVDAEGLEFEHILRDIQTLNDWAREGRLEFTAISVHAYAYVRDKYAILTHGASMGDGYGPMVVGRTPMTPEAMASKRIAIPGMLTSAFLALSLYIGREFDFVVLPFDQIMEAVHAGDVEAGLIIHEGQLTHQIEGLYTLVDLGLWWKEETGLPLPLGVNAIRKDLPPDLQAKASRVLKRSIVHGLENRGAALDHAMQFARDMEKSTADTFVGMYVNDWTVDMGDAGRESIRLFLRRGEERGLIPAVGDVEFVS